VEFIDEPRYAILTAIRLKTRQRIIIRATYKMFYAKRLVMLVGVCCRVLFLPLLERTFEIGVHYKRKPLLPVVVAERQPLVVVVGKNDGAVVYFPAVDAVS
jgi:hypothetical protein